MKKDHPFSEELIEKIYLSKVLFLYISKNGTILASPVIAGHVNVLDINLWDEFEKDETRKDALLRLIKFMVLRNFECDYSEEEGNITLTLQAKE